MMSGPARRRVQIETDGPEFTQDLGRALGRALRAGDSVLLDGPLGAGKTCLTRGLAEGLGLEPRQVSSPTFVIVNRYEQPGPGVARIDATPMSHVDAYRLGGAEDLETLGWDRVADGSSVVVIEWASRLAAAAPQDPTATARVTLEPTADDRRRLVIDVPAHWLDRRNAEALARLMDGERCRLCGRALPAEGGLGPFCGERCRDADLGGWLTGRYVVPGQSGGSDPDAP